MFHQSQLQAGREEPIFDRAAELPLKAFKQVIHAFKKQRLLMKVKVRVGGGLGSVSGYRLPAFRVRSMISATSMIGYEYDQSKDEFVRARIS